MAKVKLPPVTSGYNLQRINDNFKKIEDNINNHSIQRDVGNNTINQDLDMDGNKVVNVRTDKNDPRSLVTMEDLTSQLANLSYGEYNFIGDYSKGITLSGYNQLVRDSDGEFWRASGKTILPYKLTGEGPPEGGNLVPVGDSFLRNQLAQGTAIIDGESASDVANSQRLRDELNNRKYGAAIVNRGIVSVSSVEDLKSLSKEQRRGDLQYSVASYRDGSLVGGGMFVWKEVNLKDECDSDPFNGVFVAPEGDDGEEGAFVRVYKDVVMAEWFGAEPWKIGGSQDSTKAFQACADFTGRGGTWRWSGRHRITDTIVIPTRQTFGSFGQMTSVSVELFDPSNFQGVHTSPFESVADKIDSAVFFDSASGEAFRCYEAAKPTNFLLYGRGLTEIGISTEPIPKESSFYNTTGIRHGKYIRPSNVTIILFRRAFDSNPWDTGGNYVGNYYTTYTNCEITLTHTAFSVQGNETFNTKSVNTRINARRFGSFSVGVRDFRFIGGSIEGFGESTYIRTRSNISFSGTYFETFNSEFKGTLFNIIGGCTFSARDCLVYLNHIKYFVSSGGDGQSAEVSYISLNSNGNEFRLGETNSASTVYSVHRVAKRTYGMFSDVISVASGSTVTYTPGSVPSDSVFQAPLQI